MKQFEVSSGNLGELLSKLKQLVRPNVRYMVTITEWDKRTLDANAVYHVWVKMISEFTGEDIRTTELRCKRDHGIPILLSGKDGEIAGWMLAAANYYHMDDHSQLMFISGMEVTRTFSTKEHNDYRRSIQAFWHGYGLNLQYKNR